MGRAALAIVLLTAACSRASDDSSAKRAPNTPPPSQAALNAEVHIDVIVDGAPGAVIDAARLAAVAPDFEDADRRAWRLSRLLPGFDRVGRVVDARAATGPTVRLDYPSSDASGMVPVLLLTRRGELVASVLDPVAPFPAYHGQGGQLGRGGDPLPRLAGVRSLHVGNAPP